MNRKVRIFICIFIPIVLFIVFVWSFMYNITNTNTNLLKIEDEVIDNRYNNVIANTESNLVKIKNRLYYNYYSGDIFKYGTYEVSSGLTKRVYWEGPSLSPGFISLNNVWEDKILDTYLDENGTANYFDIDDKKYKPCFTVDNDKDIVLDGYYFIVDGVQYYFSKDERLYILDNGKLRFIASPELLKLNDFNFMDNCYINSNYIYYKNFVNNEIYICRFDIDKQKVINEYCIKDIPHTENGFENFIAKEDDIYFLTENHNKLYHVDLKDNSAQKLFETAGVITFNCYNDKLYVSVHLDSTEEKSNGLYIIDTKTSEINHIYDKMGVYGIYILDNKWVYFTDKDDYLYRITKDGKNIEKVFG